MGNRLPEESAGRIQKTVAERVLRKKDMADQSGRKAENQGGWKTIDLMLDRSNFKFAK